MCLSDMEGLFLGHSVMGREVTLPPTVIGANPRLRKQRMPSSKSLDDAAKKLIIRAHFDHALSAMIWAPEQGSANRPQAKPSPLPAVV